MNWFSAVCLAFGIITVIAAIGMGFAIALRARPWLATRDAAFLLSVGSIFGGVLVASIATPDWNPITMLGFYAPFLVIGVWMAVVSSQRAKCSV